jgi:glycosyltransferase involved in cell wall biosynthesis
MVEMSHVTSSPARPPHLLYVAWGFPPSRTGGVHRALATVNAFAADGWDVTVLTVPREVFRDVTGADPRLEELVDPAVDVRRIPFSWPAQQTDLRAWPLVRVLFPRLWATVRKRRDLRAFPEVGYGPWRAPLERAALEVHAQHPVDLVVATTNPEVSVTAGVRLHEEVGVPYVVDYRDAWSLHTYSGRRRHTPDSPVGRWEARSLAGAAQLWLVNEPLRRWHAEAYPSVADRMHVVMNGYDRDLPDDLVRVPGPDRPLRYGYLGTMTHVVPLAEFVAGWRRGRALSPQVAEASAQLHGYLGYYATPDAGLAAIVDGAADAAVGYRGPVSKTDVAATYATFDVLLFLLGGGAYVTSGKVFEYMSTGLPIVSVTTPGCAANEVLAGYPRWHPAADLSPDAIAAALAAAADDARADDAPARAAAAREHARRYRRDRQLAPRIAELRDLVGARRPPAPSAASAAAEEASR